MSAFREYVPIAGHLLAEQSNRPDPMTEMRALAGAQPLEEWGEIPATGPTGPRALQQSPRPRMAMETPRDLSISVVANDPGVGLGWAARAREARIAATRSWQEENDRAILTDPRVQSGLRTVYRLVQDLDDVAKRQQATMENLRLQISHLMGQSARTSEQTAQLKQNLPRLYGLLQTIAEGSLSREIREQVGSVLAELESAGFYTDPNARKPAPHPNDFFSF